MCKDLMVAVYEQNTELVKHLLERGADPCFAFNGVNLLQVATYNKDFDTMQLLLSYKSPHKEALKMAHDRKYREEEIVIIKAIKQLHWMVWIFLLIHLFYLLIGIAEETFAYRYIEKTHQKEFRKECNLPLPTSQIYYLE